MPLEYPENTGGLGKGGVNPPSFRLARFRPEQEFVRTVYLPIIRSGPQAGPAEVRNVFDFTQPGEFAGQRTVTTVPTQALFLMNAEFLEAAGPRAGPAARRRPRTIDARLEGLWLRVLNRPITAEERADSAAFLAEVRNLNPTAIPHPASFVPGRSCVMPCWPPMNSSCVCDRRPAFDHPLTPIEARHDRPLPYPGGRCDRRQLLRAAACGFGSLALQGMMSGLARAARGPLAARAPHFAPRAKRVIFLFIQGGPSQLDLFDPKPLITRKHGEKISPPIDGNKVTIGVDKYLALAPIAPVRPAATSGMMISDLMPHLASVADDLCLLRAVHTDNEAHAPATLQLHTGVSIDVRPSMGSWFSYGLGTENENLPSFITIHPDSDVRTYGSGFLPAAHQGTPVNRDGRQGSRDQVPGRRRIERRPCNGGGSTSSRG